MKGDGPQSLTSRELADVLGVSESSVKRWVDSGEVAAMRTGGGHRRIPLNAAVQFIRKHKAAPRRPELLNDGEPPLLGPVDADAAEQLYGAIVRDDLGYVRAIVHGRYLAGGDIAAIGDGLIRPVLERIGELWRCQGSGVLIEHRAVQLCMQVLSELQAWIPQPPAIPAAVAASAPLDPYLLPPLLTSMCLRERGIEAKNLGPLTPIDAVLAAVRKYKAVLCCISISSEKPGGSDRDWKTLGDALQKRRVRVLVGGRCVDRLPAPFRARVAVGRTLAELAAAVPEGNLQAGS